MSGVTNSVLRVTENLQAAGHSTMVIAPDWPQVPSGEQGTWRTLSVPLPPYPQMRVGLARVSTIAAELRRFRPDVVHLASPFVLGWQALLAAELLGLPTVAVYQTDVAAYARSYGMPGAAALVSGHLGRLHRRATITLAPSTASLEQLADLGVERRFRWGRGVDSERFHPSCRSRAWRDRIAPGERIVGYVGRLAPEKQVVDLRVLADIPGVRLVIVGDGPERAALQQALPTAIFLGHLRGAELAQAVAGFDVFVHPGESETFGQTIQEAFASGVPVVATGRGGPVDLVRSSIDGWLYRPGDLADLRARVLDLLGDEAKRAAFRRAARDGVRERTWAVVTERLVGHYEHARALQQHRAGSRTGAPRPGSAFEPRRLQPPTAAPGGNGRRSA